MLEIRWHSRAGQGAVTGAKGLADVIATTGKEVQAFALYGSAKRGAAMSAYDRIDDKPILNHEKYMEPDYVLVIDPGIVFITDICANEKPDTKYIITTHLTKDELIAKKLAYLDDGALIVNLGDDMPPALIKRKDGGSLYMTRDLAALLYRKKVLNFDKILYVVGNEQKLHFEQLKKIIELMGYDFKDEVYHVGFGLYLVNGKKMSTRQGGVTKLYDVLEKAISLALEQINLKNPNLANKEEVATKVGVAAVLFNDLKNHRELNIEFDLNSCVKFEGQTGPYLQYSSVRIASILKNQELDLNNLDETVYDNDDYFDIIKQLSNFTNTIEKACIDNAPSYIAKYLLNLAQSFNKLYSLYKLNVSDDKVRNANFALIKAIRIVINEGLRLLGIDYLNEM